MEPVAEDSGDALREVKAEPGVVRTLAAEADGVEHHRVDLVERVGIEMPTVRGKQPCPPEDVARVERVEGLHAPPWCGDSDCNPAGTQSPERVGVPSLADDRCARGDHNIASASRQHLEMVRRHSGKESMCCQLVGDALHVAFAVRAPSLDRIAAASSVMSMPTGHQAMHRPHPTQPEVSN